jgi:hypothetical protein
MYEKRRNNPKTPKILKYEKEMRVLVPPMIDTAVSVVIGGNRKSAVMITKPVVDHLDRRAQNKYVCRRFKMA